jgi:hypothetical protein
MKTERGRGGTAWSMLANLIVYLRGLRDDLCGSIVTGFGLEGTLAAHPVPARVRPSAGVTLTNEMNHAA